VRRQEVEAGRNNVIGRWRGSGDGASLMFLAHMDVAPGVGKAKSEIVDGRWISGLGASNMKVSFAAYWMATKMLLAAGLQPRGDLIIAGVIGEIERAPIGQYQGAAYRGAGFGASYMASHGVLPDLVINGEPTGLRVQIVNGGYHFIRVTTRGVTQHSAYRHAGVDAIAKMEKVIPRVRAWEETYRAKYPHHLMRPSINLGAIEGGYPPTPSLVPNFCHLYVDIMLNPGVDVIAVYRDFEDLLRGLNREDPDLGLEWELYMTSKGYEIGADEYVVQAMKRAHRQVLGVEPVEPDAHRFGVSSDNHAFYEYGTRGVTYGVGGISRTKPGVYGAYDPDYGEVVGIDHLEAGTKVYALAALDLLSQERQAALARK
jgi:acetylornithine deacetylase/succinyl-diaminopimelate desuccinylase-like protein